MASLSAVDILLTRSIRPKAQVSEMAISTNPVAFPRHPLFRSVLFSLALICMVIFLFRSYFSLRPSSSQFYLANQLSSTLLDDVLNSTLGFQKIFVINLPSRTDHRDATSLAAHFTGLDLEYVDGVTELERKTLPPSPEDFSMQSGAWNAWRAHMNLARTIVEQNITSALIIEDDVDWDLRIKSQLRSFAQASQLLLQPLQGTQDQYLDPTLPRQSHSDSQPDDLHLNSGPVTESLSSPYGDVDRWDVLWLGHCGARWPDGKKQPHVPLGRVVIHDDETVPQTQFLEFEEGDKELPSLYPNHTRVVHTGAGNTCSFAYAITLSAARHLLYEFGMKKISGAFDQMLPDMCVGRNGRKRRSCLTVQPQYFHHHRPVGPESSWSDIADYSIDKTDSGYHNRASTRNIRLSTKVNFPKLVDGETDYIDQFPDVDPGRAD